MTAIGPTQGRTPNRRPSYSYFPATGPSITYSKTALWLSTLERTLGWETLQRIMSVFFRRWSFRHPRPDDFFAAAGEVSGHDLTHFFDQVYRKAAVFDYADRIRQQRRNQDPRIDGLEWHTRAGSGEEGRSGGI